LKTTDRQQTFPVPSGFFGKKVVWLKSRRDLLNPTEENQVKKINGQHLEFINNMPDRISKEGDIFKPVLITFCQPCEQRNI
jgi:hypothetical protein